MGPPSKKRLTVATKKEPVVEAVYRAHVDQQPNTYVISSMLTESGEVVNVMSMPDMGTIDGVEGVQEIQFDLHPNFLDGQGQDEQSEDVILHTEEELGHAEIILGGHDLEDEQENFNNLSNLESEQVDKPMKLKMHSRIRKPIAKAKASHSYVPSDTATASERPSQNRKIMRVPEKLFHHIMNKSLNEVRNMDQTTLPFSYAGQSFSVQAQKLILNATDFFKRHKRDPFILNRLGTPLEQAGKILNVSPSVIGKIRRRFERLGKIIVPGLIRKKVKTVLDRVDADQEAIIRNTVQEFSRRRIPPTVPRLLIEVQDKINFVGSRTSFRRILLRMGFKYAKVNKRTIIVDPNQKHTP